MNQMRKGNAEAEFDLVTLQTSVSGTVQRGTLTSEGFKSDQDTRGYSEFEVTACLDHSLLQSQLRSPVHRTCKVIFPKQIFSMHQALHLIRIENKS